MYSIDGLQPISRYSLVVAAMSVEQTKEAIEKSFVYDHQRGGDDVICKPKIHVHTTIWGQFYTQGCDKLRDLLCDI